MKRLTLRLTDDLYRQLRILAAKSDTSAHKLSVDTLAKFCQDNEIARQGSTALSGSDDSTHG